MCPETESVRLVASSVVGSCEAGSLVVGSCAAGSCAVGSCVGCGGFAACSLVGVRSVLRTNYYNVSHYRRCLVLCVVHFFLSLIRGV
jgi:hypothetical protein